MVKLADEKVCTGCGACYSICPNNAIEMKKNDEGFLFPEINEENCTNCNLCARSCPVLREYKGNSGHYYACVSKDDKVKKASSSGGVFSLIAEKIIDLDGVVFGAVFDESLNVVHTYTENKEGLEKLRGSKYVQSKIGDTYKKAKEFLEEGRFVLFTGTPCQIGGLYSYLKKDYDKLYTQDMVCHGVPSEKVWETYKKFREKKSGAKLRRIFFRHKNYDWKRFCVLFEFSNNTQYLQIFFEDLYMKGFLENLSLRKSCYNCHYKHIERESDITLADFWGVQKVLPEMYDKMGTSLVFVNSQKGEKLFELISDSIKYKEVDINDTLKFNSAINASVKEPNNRSAFFEDIEKLSFDEAIKRNIAKKPVKTRIKRFIKKFI